MDEYNLTTETKYFFAVDLGATSGRTILGELKDGKLETEELTRFPNVITQIGGHFYWNVLSLYGEIIRGLKAAAQLNVKIESIGIDTWGVDVVAVCNPRQLGQLKDFIEGWVEPKEDWE